MSDPMTNPEIEDVLSSIRRLVSEDNRPAMRAASAEMGKLVLTPALRVPDEEMPDDAVDPADPAMDEGADEAQAYHHTDGDSAADAGFHDDAEAAEAADDDQPSDEARAPEVPAEHTPEAQAEAWQDVADETADADAPEGGFTDEAHDLDDHQLEDTAHAEETAEIAADADAGDTLVWDAAKPATSLEDRIAELEAAVGAQPDDWEPDGSEQPEPAAAATAAIFSLTGQSMRDHGGYASDISDAFDGVDDLEGADRTARDPIAGDTSDDTETRSLEEEEQEYHGDDRGDDSDEIDFGLDDGDDQDGDDAFLDEEALREMVSHIIREELQGLLGERITRNVRRLVRREVQRALTLRDFE